MDDEEDEQPSSLTQLHEELGIPDRRWPWLR